jgi:hypothetical protein
MRATFVELERTTRVAPFGVRLWDRPTARTVWDGLRLTNVESRRPARPNRAGVFVAYGLPAMRDAECGTGEAAYWASPPDVRELTFDLVDELGRFHDMRFDAVAPYRGVFDDHCGYIASPPAAAPPSVPLFSLPSRAAPAGMAAVLAELTDADTRDPAAWAVLEVSAPGVDTARGIADRRGRVLVLVPYPEPPWHGTSPPPGTTPLAAQTWLLDLAVRYSPAAASPPLPGPDDAEPPDLCAVLTQLPALLSSGESPTVPVDSAELVFGRELVLNEERRTLFVTPAT